MELGDECEALPRQRQHFFVAVAWWMELVKIYVENLRRIRYWHFLFFQENDKKLQAENHQSPLLGMIERVHLQILET